MEVLRVIFFLAGPIIPAKEGNMKKIIALLMSVLLIAGLAACGQSTPATQAAPEGSTDPATGSAPEETTEAAAAETTVEETTEGSVSRLSILVGSYSMMEVKTVTDDSYAGLYGPSAEEGAARSAVAGIIAAGNAFINGFKIPATAEELASEYPDGFTVNASPWLSITENGTYKVDRDEYADYDEAVLALISRVPAGNEFILSDEDGDGFYEKIEGICRAAFIIAETYDVKTFFRADIEEENARAFDGDLAVSRVGLTASEVIGGPEAGDMAFAYATPDGWVVEKAYPVTGKLVEGIDHEYYQIDDTKYDDAMRFSRDNIVISNRCGEFTNALKYFGLSGADSDTEVTLWFVKPAYADTLGAPAGFTSEDSKAILESAINQANDKLAAHPDAPEAAAQQLLASLQKAQEVYDDAASVPEQMTYQVYLLYLTLHGSGDDIGAKFAGYDYPGFDNMIQ